MTEIAGGASVKERYQQAAEQLIKGDFQINFTQLPAAAYEATDIMGGNSQPLQGHQLLEGYCPLPKNYQHLAWWTHQAFRSEASANPSHKFFDSTGGNGVGIAMMAKSISDITYAYAGQPNRPESYDDQVAEVVKLSLTGVEILEYVAQQRMAVAGAMEKNLKLRGSKSRSMLAAIEDAQWTYVIDDSGVLRTRHSLEGSRNAIEESFLGDVEKGYVEPQRKTGCFAIRVAHRDEQTVFGSVWHGMVLAAAKNPELINQQLKDYDALMREYGR